MSDPVRFNLGEMAEILEKSRPTLRTLIRNDPSFPVEKQGGKSAEWRFDAIAVLKWWRVNGPDAALSGDGDEPTPHQRRAYWQSVQLENQVRRECGELADTRVANALYAEIFTRLRTRATRVPLLLMRQHGASREVYRACDELLTDAFNTTADELTDPAKHPVVQRAAAAWIVDPEVKEKLLTWADRKEKLP